jgi:hypothetical protein
MAKKKRSRRPAEETYRQVEQLAAKKKIPLVKAFAEVAKRTGRSAGTVKVAYYRIAQKGASAGKGRSGKRRGRPSSASTAVLQRAQAALKELSALVRSQQAEIEQLREKADRLDSLRKVLGRT